MSRLIPEKFLELIHNAMKTSRSAQSDQLTELPSGKIAANRLDSPLNQPVFGVFIPRRIPLFTCLITLCFSSVIYAVEKTSSEEPTANPIQDAETNNAARKIGRGTSGRGI